MATTTEAPEGSAQQTPREGLAKLLTARPDLIEVAGALFDYAQYLLDDDQRLTKGGALDGQGRELLKARALELLGGPERSSAEEDADEADDEADEDVDDEGDE